MNKDSLGDRMKGYEAVSKTKLVSRMPVVLRVDGRSFHTFAHGFRKPFDYTLIKAMQETMKYLCENVQNCVFGYAQSDEITLVLVDYKTLNTSAFFDNEVQKMCSIVASMATMAFNKYFTEYVNTYDWNVRHCYYSAPIKPDEITQLDKQMECYKKAIDKGAMFDCRCFNVPKEDVANAVYWRQLDAMRNSVQMVAQSIWPHKFLQGKSCEDIKELLRINKTPWEEYSIYCQRGSACYKSKIGWKIDEQMPVLKDDWNYIKQYIYVGD